MYFEDALLQREEQQLLYDFVHQLQPKRILEIGSYKGGSTRLFHLAAPNAEIVCIEPSPLFSEFENITIIRKHTPEAWELLTGTFDFIFIDGNHSYAGCLSDIQQSRRFTHDNSVVVLHDANYYEVENAINTAMTDNVYDQQDILFVSQQKDGDVTWGGLIALYAKTSYDNRLLQTQIGSRTVEYRKNTFDSIIIHEMESQYQEVDYTTVSTVLDIGAHAGFFANMVLDKNPNVKLYCVEMAKDNYELLKTNLTNTSAKAIYARIGYTTKDHVAIRWLDGNTGSGRLIPKGSSFPEGTSTISVSGVVLTVETIIKNNRILRVDVLKLDCEGSEKDILENITQEATSKIKHIVGEYHYTLEEALGFLNEFCAKHNFTLVSHSDTDGLGFFYLKNND